MKIKRLITLLTGILIVSATGFAYSNTEIDTKLSEKANKDGTNITNVENWRATLGVMSSDETNELLNNKANKDASNLSEDNVNKWIEKLGVITNTNANDIVNSKLNADGSNVEADAFRRNLDVYNKQEINNLSDSKANLDGTNIDSKSFRDNLDVYSKDETNGMVNSKANLNGDNLSKEDAIEFRNNLGVYSKEEADYKILSLKKDVMNDLPKLEEKISKIKKEMVSGISGAMAMANLPQPVFVGDTGMSVATGTYDSGYATAFGISNISTNGRVVLKSSISVDNSTKIGFGAGMFIKLGR